MAFAEDLLNKILKKSKSTFTNPKGEKVEVEKLIRSYAFNHEFNVWKVNPETIVKLNTLKENLLLSYQGFTPIIEVSSLKMKSANGFVFYFDETIEQHEFPFLIDYIMEKTLAFNYRLYHGKIEAKTTTKKESYYLKPALQFDEQNVVNQQFGNVTLDLIFEANNVKYLKCLVSFYHGRNYTNALGYDDYLSKVLTP